MLRYTITPTPLGQMLLAATEQGICALGLDEREQELLAFLEKEFPTVMIVHDDQGLQGWADELTGYLTGQGGAVELPLDIKASGFQKQVYQVLRKIPYGSTRSYQEVAQAVGRPAACRAVANACACNKVSLIVPCHRVIRKNGALGGYRWGVKRKEALLDLEKQRLGLIK